jgi:5'-nucleotidase
MRAIIDIDGVLADNHTPWLDLYNLDYNDHMTKEDIHSWDMDKLVKPECGRKIYEYLKRPELYVHAPQIKNSIGGVQVIRDMGFEILFVTSGFYMSKIDWMFRHGYTKSTMDNPELIICANKQLIKADIIIDDRPSNLEGFKYPICFDQPWNQDYDGVRAKGWIGVIQLIKEINL